MDDNQVNKDEEVVNATWAKLTPDEQTIIENDVVKKVELMCLMYIKKLEWADKTNPPKEGEFRLDPYTNMTMAIGKWLGFYPYAKERLPSWDELNKAGEEFSKKLEEEMKAEGWIITKNEDGSETFQFKPEKECGCGSCGCSEGEENGKGGC